MARFFNYLPVLSLAFLWAFYGPLLRFLESIGLNVFDVNFLGFSLGAVLLLLIFKAQKAKLGFPAKTEAKKLLFYAVSLSSTNLFLFYAFTLSTFANTILLHYTGLLWGSLAAIVLFREKVTKWKAIAAALCVIGIGVIFLPSVSLSEKFFVGNIAALASSFGYGGMILASRSLKESDSKKVSFYSVLLCALFYLPLFVFFGSQKEISGIFFGLSTGGAYSVIEALFVIYGMKAVSVIAASIILVLEIPMTILVGFLFYSEGIPFATMIGGILITLGVLLLVAKDGASKAG
ncbi:MAG: DMT family transporter [archaeon]|nr:DMT family transporter [archaeon]